MRKIFYTLLVTAGVVGLSAGAMAAGDDAMTYYNDGNAPAQGMEQSTNNADTNAQATGSQANVNANANVNGMAATDSTQVQSVQASLRDEGYAVSVDGVWGPQTAEALRQFQTANNLSPTGEIDSETLSALDIER